MAHLADIGVDLCETVGLEDKLEFNLNYKKVILTEIQLVGVLVGCIRGRLWLQ